MNPMIEINALSYQYPDGKQALDKYSFATDARRKSSF